MNDEAARQGRPDTRNITGTEHSPWPRCRECGSRAQTTEFLERHRLRRCVGHPELAVRALNTVDRAVDGYRKRAA